jgi:hypothetical protein
VFRAQGLWVGKGLALGVDDTTADVQAAVNRLADVRPNRRRIADRSVEYANPNTWRGGAQPVVHVHVAGNVTAEQNLAKAIASTVRDEIVRTGKRNGGRTGL